MREAFAGFASNFGFAGAQADAVFDRIVSKSGAAALGVAAIGTATIVAIDQLYKLGKEWDDVADGITVRTGKLGDDLKGITDSVKDVATTTAAPLNEIGDVASRVAQSLHVTGQPLTDLTQAVSRLNEMTGEKLNIRDFGKVMRQFKIDVEKDGVGTLDTFLNAWRDTGIPINELITALSNVAPAARDFNLSMGETASLISTLEQAGLDENLLKPAFQRFATFAAKDGKDVRTELEKIVNQIATMPDDAARQVASEAFGARNFEPIFQAIRDGTVDVQGLNESLKNTGPSINETYNATKDWSEEFDILIGKLKTGLEPAASNVFGGINTLLTSTSGQAENARIAIGGIAHALTPMSGAIDALMGKGNVWDALFSLASPGGSALKWVLQQLMGGGANTGGPHGPGTNALNPQDTNGGFNIVPPAGGGGGGGGGGSLIGGGADAGGVFASPSGGTGFGPGGGARGPLEEILGPNAGGGGGGGGVNARGAPQIGGGGEGGLAGLLAPQFNNGAGQAGVAQQPAYNIFQQRAISSAQRRAVGQPYQYGAAGNNNQYDCSGIASAIYSDVTGTQVRFFTDSDFASYGFQPGYQPGALNIGTNGGSGMGGHMALTLPNGVNVESGGDTDTTQYGGSAIGARDFGQVWHLPLTNYETGGDVRAANPDIGWDKDRFRKPWGPSWGGMPSGQWHGGPYTQGSNSDPFWVDEGRTSGEGGGWNFGTAPTGKKVGPGGASVWDVINSIIDQGQRSHFDGGGAATGGTGKRDDVPAMLTGGEHVLTVEDVQALGGQNAVYAMRQRLHQNFENGGAADLEPAPGQRGYRPPRTGAWEGQYVPWGHGKWPRGVQPFSGIFREGIKIDTSTTTSIGSNYFPFDWKQYAEQLGLPIDGYNAAPRPFQDGGAADLDGDGYPDDFKDEDNWGTPTISKWLEMIGATGSPVGRRPQPTSIFGGRPPQWPGTKGTRLRGFDQGGAVDPNLLDTMVGRGGESRDVMDIPWLQQLYARRVGPHGGDSLTGRPAGSSIGFNRMEPQRNNFPPGLILDPSTTSYHVGSMSGKAAYQWSDIKDAVVQDYNEVWNPVQRMRKTFKDPLWNFFQGGKPFPTTPRKIPVNQGAGDYRRLGFANGGAVPGGKSLGFQGGGAVGGINPNDPGYQLLRQFTGALAGGGGWGGMAGSFAEMGLDLAEQHESQRQQGNGGAAPPSGGPPGGGHAAAAISGATGAPADISGRASSSAGSPGAGSVMGLGGAGGMAAGMFPGGSVAASLAARTAQFGGQALAIGAQGLMETFLPNGSPLGDPSKSLFGRLAQGISGARPAPPMSAGQQDVPQQMQPQDPHTGSGAPPGPGGVGAQAGSPLIGTVNMTTPSDSQAVARDIDRQIRAHGAGSGH